MTAQPFLQSGPLRDVHKNAAKPNLISFEKIKNAEFNSPLS